MSGLVRATDVEHVGERVLRVTFSDGLVRELDFEGSLVGILSTLDSAQLFGEAAIDEVAGTVCWPGGIDLDPDVLYGSQSSASAVRPILVREFRLQQAG